MTYLKREIAANGIVLELTGSLTGPWANQEFQEALDDAVSANPRRLVLNLIGIEAINSSCLGKIFLTMKHLKERGIQFQIHGCTPDVFNTLQLVRADTVLEISLEPEPS